jgi:O-antigen/teichoic acid export membrane protein
MRNNDAGKNRNRSILKFFATSIGSRGIGIACGLLQVPFAIAYLGNEAFGLWITFMSIGYMLAFTDFGIGLGVQNQIAEALGNSDPGRAQRIFSSSFVYLCGLMLILMAIVVPLCFVLDLPGFLRLTEPKVVSAAATAVGAVAVFWCVNIPLGLGQRIAYGAQLGWMHNVSASIGNVVTLGVVFAAARQDVGIANFFILTSAAGALVNAAFLLFILRRLGWLRLPQEFMDFSILRNLAKVGFFFFIQQIASMALFALPPIVLSATLGAATVTPYNLAQRIFGLLLVVSNAILLPVWPAYSEAKAQNDWRWIERTLIRSVLAVILLTVLPMAGIAIFAPQIINLWTNGAAVLPPRDLVWLLFAWNAVTVLQQPFGYLLAGLSQLRRATICSVLTTIASLTLMHLLIPHLGVNGVPLGLILGFVPFIFLGTVSETFSLLKAARANRDKTWDKKLQPVGDSV